jgi:hypothetical protein
MITVWIVDTIVPDSGIVLQVVTEIIIALYGISRSGKKISVGIFEDPSKNYNQYEQSGAQNGHGGNSVFIHKSISYLTGNIAKIGYFMGS